MSETEEDSIISHLGFESTEKTWRARFLDIQTSIRKEIFEDARPTQEAIQALLSIFKSVQQTDWKMRPPTSISLDGDGGFTIEFNLGPGSSDIIEATSEGEIESISIRNGKVRSRKPLATVTTTVSKFA
ncbi:MAG: hypothetical protein CMO55_14600 [Verrucomicrobiales bacterium]|nr:hypothetical protein [Verrucomicrobiales bacterium]